MAAKVVSFVVLALSCFSDTIHAKPWAKRCASDPLLEVVAHAQQLSHGRFCFDIDRTPIFPGSPDFRELEELKLACKCIEHGYRPPPFPTTTASTPPSPIPTSTSSSSTPTPTGNACINDSTITTGGNGSPTYDYKVDCSFGPSNFTDSLVAVFGSISGLSDCAGLCAGSFLDVELIAAASFFANGTPLSKDSPYPPGNCACYEVVDSKRDGFVKMKGVDSAFLTPDPY